MHTQYTNIYKHKYRIKQNLLIKAVTEVNK